MRSGFCCRPGLGDIYEKEFIFLFHIKLDFFFFNKYDSLLEIKWLEGKVFFLIMEIFKHMIIKRIKNPPCTDHLAQTSFNI